MARVGTKTSDFGVSKREGHDASRFYGSKLYEGIRVDEGSKIIDNSQSIEDSLFDKSFLFNNENFEKIPDYSIHLALYPVSDFTSKRIEDIDLYLEGIRNLITQVKRKLVIGGRLIMIVDNHVDTSISKSGFWPVHAYIAPMVMEQGLYMRGEVILKKRDSGSNSTIQNESIKGCITNAKQIFYHGLIFSNILPNRIKKGKKSQIEKTDTISRDQFLEYTKSVWSSNTELMPIKHLQDNSNDVKIDYYSRFLYLYSFLEDSILVISNNESSQLQGILASIRKRTICFNLAE